MCSFPTGVLTTWSNIIHCMYIVTAAWPQYCLSPAATLGASCAASPVLTIGHNTVACCYDRCSVRLTSAINWPQYSRLLLRWVQRTCASPVLTIGWNLTETQIKINLLMFQNLLPTWNLFSVINYCNAFLVNKIVFIVVHDDIWLWIVQFILIIKLSTGPITWRMSCFRRLIKGFHCSVGGFNANDNSIMKICFSIFTIHVIIFWIEFSCFSFKFFPNICKKHAVIYE